MIDRITQNEERLDKLLISVRKLDEAIDDFVSNKRNLNKLKRYYGSKSWFKDKEAYEKGQIKHVKAGVLCEDAVWDVLDEIDEIKAKIKKNLL